MAAAINLMPYKLSSCIMPLAVMCPRGLVLILKGLQGQSSVLGLVFGPTSLALVLALR